MPLRSRTLGFLPTEAEATILKRWMGTYRWTWNQCVAFSRAHPLITGNKLQQELRAAFVSVKSTVSSNRLWVRETPNVVRDLAVREFICRLSTLKKLVRTGKLAKFKLGFKKRNFDICLFPYPSVTGTKAVDRLHSSGP